MKYINNYEIKELEYLPLGYPQTSDINEVNGWVLVTPLMEVYLLQNPDATALEVFNQEKTEVASATQTEILPSSQREMLYNSSEQLKVLTQTYTTYMVEQRVYHTQGEFEKEAIAINNSDRVALEIVYLKNAIRIQYPDITE